MEDNHSETSILSKQKNIRRFIAMLMRYRYSFLSRTRRIKSTNSQTLVQDRFKYYFPIYVQITRVVCVIQIFLTRFWTHFASLYVYISCTSHPTWLHLPDNVSFIAGFICLVRFSPTARNR